MVGMSGAAGLRFGVVTAIARTAPDWACGQAVVMLSKARSMCPPIMLFSSSDVLRNGTWIIVVAVASWNITPDRCDEVPIPDDPKLTLLSFAFRYSMSSGTVLAGIFRLA